MIEGFYTEGGEYFTIKELNDRKLAYNLTRRRIAVFPSDEICYQMLGILFIYGNGDDDADNEYLKKNDPNYYDDVQHGKTSVQIDAVWCFLGGCGSHGFKLLLYRHGKNLFDEIIDDCLTCNNKKQVENHTEPVNTLTTGVEKYYLMIDWDAVDEDNRRKLKESRAWLKKIMQGRSEESDGN